MEELLSKPWWEFVGVITGVILSIIAIIISIIQNKKKQLSYDIPYLYPLVKINKNVKNDFEVKYKGETIEQVCITELIIENTGNIPIRKEDFNEPIKIEIKNCSHIFNVELVETVPDNLVVIIDINNDTNLIYINPMLLNKNDSFKLKIVFEGENSSIKLSSRIVDLSEIINKSNNIQYKNIIYGVLFIVTGIVISKFSSNNFLDLFVILTGIVGINLIYETLIAIILKKKRRKQ